MQFMILYVALGNNPFE